MTCFDCKVCFGSKFTSSAEGRRFNWLIYDSMTSLFCVWAVFKIQGFVCKRFLPSFPSIHRPVILCSRTAQKRLLRRLRTNRHESFPLLSIRYTGSRFARYLENIASWVYTGWAEIVVDSTRFDRIDTNRFPCCRFVIPEVDLQES